MEIMGQTLNLKTAVSAIEGRKEFIQKKLNGLVIINYLITIPDSFDGIRKEFRGIVFDETTGEIVSRPLHKFFNVNQKDETQLHVLGNQKCRKFEKLDGTMCHALEVNGEVVLASRMGWETDWAKAATKVFNKLSMKDDFVNEVRSGNTVIFEYIGPNNPIVVPYMKEELVYLWSRNRKTGEYFYNKRDGIRCSENEETCLFDVMKEIETLENKEGFVCVLEDGTWVKVKCAWYLNLHGAFDNLMNPAYHLYEIALNNEMDDLISQCPEKFHPKLKEIDSVVSKDKLKLIDEITVEFEKLNSAISCIDPRQCRKEFAISAQKNENFSVLMAMFNKKDDIEKFFNRILYEKYREGHQYRLFEVLEEN